MNRVTTVAVLGLAFAGAAADKPIEPKEKVSVTLTLVAGGDLAGPVLAYNNDGIAIEFRNAPHAVPWSLVETGSAYRARRALFEDERGGRDELTAEDHFQLGMFALRRDRLSLARREFKLAVELDDGWQDACDSALAMFEQWKVNGKPIKGASTREREAEGAEPSGPEKLTRTAGSAVLPPTESRRYLPQSPAQREEMMTLYKAFGERVRTRLGDQLQLIETDHFLIWTDWSSLPRARLGPLCEAVYKSLCGQFNLSPQENIFLGKCPVFCFRSRAGYKKFARHFDDYDAKRSHGYTLTAKNGHVHIVLYRYGNAQADYDRLAANLVHEGCHAFLHRYRSNRPLKGWLAEGLANLLAERVLQKSCANGETADLLAWVWWKRRLPIEPVLRDGDSMPGHVYPLAHSLVGFLIQRDANALALVISDVKDGMTVERSLGRRYGGMTYATLEKDWFDHVAAEAAKADEEGF